MAYPIWQRWDNYDPLEAFWDQVDFTGNCWVWQGFKDPDGYGSYGSKKLLKAYSWGKRAHKIAYLSLGGHIPKDHVLDHTCRNRACVNPAHLEPVTTGENTRRGAKARKSSKRLSGSR